MAYVIVFLAGAAAAASALAIWYYAYVSLLRKERKSIEDKGHHLASQLADVSQQAKTVEAARSQLNEDVAAFNARKVQ